ncbi:MAG: phosphoglucosamine mutase [Bacteroidetes bacterium]|nr:MAG: phosphoglucosamine mutase [Bacteroidota bacterium]PIE87763.1 MAG: phosphoglucosamine mutase [Bacteroidota bacterium]
MTLIRSISGIRGTIGGVVGEGLTPPDLVKYATAFAQYLKDKTQQSTVKVVVGRDGRISGKMVNDLVCATLVAMGVDVVNLGLSTTPTVAMNVPRFDADGGIILTASHNPAHWNALKLLDERGEFLDAVEGERVLTLAESTPVYPGVDSLGLMKEETDSVEFHLEKILALPYVKREAIAKADFKVVVDGINSSGGVAVPQLLEALGVTEVITLNGTPDGHFAHNPEPIAAHLSDICDRVIQEKAHLGIVVDPDVDRLAFVDEKGMLWGEEYTLVACADYILSKKGGNTVSNLSSSRALRDLTKRFGGEYSASAVGEVNVVKRMKETHAIIGGEGNGGVILPELHYGRDALVGIALVLSLLTELKLPMSEVKKRYPEYHIAKRKMQLHASTNVDALLEQVMQAYSSYPINTIDGVKIDLPHGWIHLRKSNTEPIIRIYTETKTMGMSDKLAEEVMAKLQP